MQVSWEGYCVNPPSSCSQVCAWCACCPGPGLAVGTAGRRAAVSPVPSQERNGVPGWERNRAVTFLGHVKRTSTHLQDGGKQGRLKPWGEAVTALSGTVNPHLNQRHLCSCWPAHGLAGARRALRC